MYSTHMHKYVLEKAKLITCNFSNRLDLGTKQCIIPLCNSFYKI